MKNSESSITLDIPVLFLVFNRLDTSEKVFEQIRHARPKKLYIACDGARNEIEKLKVEKVREVILSKIDWDCNIHTLFREQNLGCKIAVSQAISWFFDNEEYGIVLEDDCLPSPSFFVYCSELLKKYQYDERIYLISGYNKKNKWSPQGEDYFFSNLGGIWGWASWRRAWRHFDLEMNDLEPFVRGNKFIHLLGSKVGKIRQKHILSANRMNISAWDYQWGFARHKNSGLACVPSVSLIKNIGFGSEGTHTAYTSDDGVTLGALQFPLNENKFIVADRDYDYQFIKSRSLLLRIKDFFYRKFINFVGKAK